MLCSLLATWNTALNQIRKKKKKKKKHLTSRTIHYRGVDTHERRARNLCHGRPLKTEDTWDIMII